MSAILTLERVSKKFPGVLALDGIDMGLERGEVHGLLGENGAGKSTLVKVIAGVYRRDGGRLRFQGQDRDFATPAEASAAGITVIHQETSLIPTLSVLENIFLGIEPVRFGIIDSRSMRGKFDEVCRRLDFHLPPQRLARDLSVAEQKMTEIMKAMVRRASFIVMDEPTDALASEEIAHLFRVIADLRRDMVTILYITHYLDEVFRITDRITVLKDGRKVGTRSTSEVDHDAVVRMMIGQEVDLQGTSRPATGQARRGSEAIRAEALSRGRAVRGVSFSAFHGEILGITGVLGSGKTELARLLFGADRPDSGSVVVRGRPCRFRSPRDAAARDIGMLPEDRKNHGLILSHEVFSNITIASLRKLSRWIFVDGARERAAAEAAVRKLDIRMARPDQAVRDLSGGNQQKVVIAKWLAADKKVLIMDEPTRGIDVGAKAEIHRILRELADKGMSIMLTSSELPELVNLPDRCIVLYKGRKAAEFTRETMDSEKLVAAQIGHAGETRS